MRRPKLPLAKPYTDRHGRTRWRYRVKGFSRELGTEYGSEDFKRRYAEAEAEYHGKRAQGAGISRNPPGSLSELIASFYKSPDWQSLADLTMRTYRGPIEALRMDYGHLPVKEIRRRHVMSILAKKAETPSAANNLRKRLAQLLDHAIALEWIETNPARLVKPYRTEAGGFKAWDETEISRFFEAFPFETLPHRAVVLMLYTGAARVDAVKLGPWNVKGQRIQYRRQKTSRSGGVMVDIPIHPDLAEVLRTLPDDRPFLATEEGKPRSVEGLGNAMRKWCDKAGLHTCSAHGLRKACARRLAEAGASPHEIMAVTGHKTLAEVQRYTDSALREGLADRAFEKLLARPNREQTVVNLGDRFTTKSSQVSEKKGR